MFLESNASRKSFFKRPETEGFILALFNQQKALRFEDNFSEIATERLFSSTWAFIKEFTQEFKNVQLDTWVITPLHLICWPFNFFFRLFKGWDSELQKSFYVSCVNIFFPFEAFRACFGFYLPELGSSGTIASNLISTGRHSWINCTVLLWCIQTKHTTQQDNWEETSCLPGKSVLPFYFAINRYSFLFPSISAHCHHIGPDCSVEHSKNSLVDLELDSKAIYPLFLRNSL